MGPRLLGWLGVDSRQWVALTRVALKRDFRQSSMSSFSHGRTGRGAFLTLLFFYLITGLAFIPVFLTTENVAFSVNLLVIYTMFMVGGLILVEYHTVVVSPDDFAVLGFRPVCSRTLFFVKLTNILFYVLTFTGVLALPTVATFWVSSDFHPMVGFATLLSVLLANFTIAMAVVLLYTLLMRKVSASQLQNAMAMLQIALAFLVYSSFFVLPKLLSKPAADFFDIGRKPWLALVPSTWFSSYVSLAMGRVIVLELLLAIASVMATIFLTYLAMAKLSVTYSESLLSLSDGLSPARSSRKFQKPFLLFAHAHEERVVSKLIRNQFLHDNRFKMAVLSILPLTFFYLFLGIFGDDGPLPDPFVIPEFEMGQSGLLYLLIFLFPMMLRTFVTQSDSYQASWIFYAAPVDFRRMIIAEKNFLMIYFVLPFLFILALVFYYFFSTTLHVLLHILVLGLLAHLFLQFAFLFSPDLPFSRPNVRGGRSRNLAIFLVLVPFILYFFLPLIFRYVYTAAASYLVFVITVLTVSLILETLIQVRVNAYLKKVEFTG
jgi:hypothetical protein